MILESNPADHLKELNELHLEVWVMIFLNSGIRHIIERHRLRL